MHFVKTFLIYVRRVGSHIHIWIIFNSSSICVCLDKHLFHNPTFLLCDEKCKEYSPTPHRKQKVNTYSAAPPEAEFDGTLLLLLLPHLFSSRPHLFSSRHSSDLSSPRWPSFEDKRASVLRDYSVLILYPIYTHSTM